MLPYAGRGHVLIGDAWFGGVRSAFVLYKELGTFSIMVVKTNSKGFPKKKLKDACKKRGDVINMSLELEGVLLQATAHMDKKPLTLIHTADSIAPGAPRWRTFSRWDKKTHRVHRAVFKLDQPSVASVYRAKFWHVDRFNKLSLGPDSLQYAVRTLDWKTRFFFGMVGISESNAYLAHCATQDTAGQP